MIKEGFIKTGSIDSNGDVLMPGSFSVGVGLGNVKIINHPDGYRVLTAFDLTEASITPLNLKSNKMYNDQTAVSQEMPKHISVAQSMASDIFTFPIIEQIELIQELKATLVKKRILSQEENQYQIEKLQEINKILSEGNQIILTQSAI